MTDNFSNDFEDKMRVKIYLSTKLFLDYIKKPCTYRRNLVAENIDYESMIKQEP